MNHALPLKRLGGSAGYAALVLIGPLLLWPVVWRSFRHTTQDRKPGSLAGMHIEEITNMYSARSFSIGATTRQDAPIELAYTFSPADIGKTRRYHVLAISDFDSRPEGSTGKLCLLCDVESRIVAVDQKESIATVLDTTKTLSSVAHASGLVRRVRVKATEEETYELAKNGSQKILRIDSHVTSRSNDMSFNSVDYGHPLTRLPDQPLRPGESCRIPWPVADNAPAKVKADPPVLEIKLVGQFVFNGRDAVLYEASQVQFEQFTQSSADKKANPGEAAKKKESPGETLIKSAMYLRRYVDVKTGWTLWAEMTERVLEPEEVKKRSELIRYRWVEADLIRPSTKTP